MCPRQESNLHNSSEDWCDIHFTTGADKQYRLNCSAIVAHMAQKPKLWYDFRMKMAQNSPIPAEIVGIVETLEKAGFQAYLVGGCVRDIFLGRQPKDWDITTNATPEKIQGLFPKNRL